MAAEEANMELLDIFLDQQSSLSVVNIPVSGLLRNHDS